MANANAIVDQMAGLGLRHGEKAAVGIATALFLFCVGLAVSKPTIDTSPDQVKKAAQVADSNLNRPEDRDAIIKKLEEQDKITATKFADTVEEQIKVKLDATAYAPKREWVTPEPGAGLIRDTPKLVAPSELYAYPGRGGVLVFALDEQGERIPAKEGEDEPEKKQRYGPRPKRRGAMGGMGGMGMGGMMGGQRKKRGTSKAEQDRQDKEERTREQRKLNNLVVGEGSKEAEKKDEGKEEGGPFKQETKGCRWVAITGTLDHGQMLANYREALKNANIAHPQYMRLDVERRTLQPDGTWSSWQKVDADKNFKILDNLPATEEDLAPENVRPDNLNDPLPFLKAGVYEKVYIASLIPKEKTQLPEEPKNQMGGMGGPGMMRMMMGGANMQNQMAQAQQSQMQMQSGMMSQMAMGMRGGMGMGGMGGSSESVGNFWKSEEKRVMIRALDFTVEPNESYRYRVRIVVANPNFSREDVSAVVAKEDVKKQVLEGPWSKETDVVVMPPDVEPYVVRTLPSNPALKPKVLFQVISFNRKDGWTVPRTFQAGIGDIVGEPAPSAVPSSDGSGTRQTLIDYTTRQIVLDLDSGGNQNLPPSLFGPSIERPAYAALLRRDGAMVVHSQADDVTNEFRRDAEANYKHEKDQSSKKRENSRGSGYAGMMQQMMGGMRGGGMR